MGLEPPPRRGLPTDSAAASPRDGLRDRRVVHVDGLSVHVEIRGQGEPLLMLNGIGAHTGMWEPIAAELARTRQLILFDAPGAGMTPPFARARRMPGFAAFVTELLDKLGVPEVDVLGYSWGGTLAQQLAHDAPSRVRRLVLVATTPGMGGKPPHPRVALAMLSPRRYGPAGMTPDTAALLYGGDYRAQRRSADPGLDRWHAQPPSARGYSHQLYAISGWTSVHWLHRLRQRTLIIAGDDDPLVPCANARLMARLIRRAELRIVPAAGHLWLLDHPREGSEIIEEFLAVDWGSTRAS